ncbi:cupin domain-containing protein [Streptomyces sp. NPDC050439]|uniref:cupin domain-containing protein n=1 Tax=unclassified Streptomyces TaxID=2593676 RepID=UPI00343B355B
MSRSAVPAAVNIAAKLSQFSELWSQKKVAVLNDYEVKLAKLKGEFVWHTHEDTDELFLVISGRLTIQLRDGDVVLEPGELFVVPRGVEHCPVADEETAILLLEPAGTINTGDAGGSMTKAAENLN